MCLCAGQAVGPDSHQIPKEFVHLSRFVCPGGYPHPLIRQVVRDKAPVYLSACPAAVTNTQPVHPAVQPRPATRGGCDLSRGLVPGPQEGGGGGGGKGGALSTDAGVVVREWGCCDVFEEEAGVCLPAGKQMWTGLWRCLSRRASSRRGLWCRPDSSLDSRGLGDGCCFQLRDFFMPPIDAPWLLGGRGVGNFAGACPQKEAVDREA